MKTTIASIVNSDKALANLLEQKLPLGISLQLGKVTKELEPIYQKVNETRGEILAKYGTADPEKPGYFTVAPEKQAEYVQEMKDNFEQEIELALPAIPISKLPEACLAAKDAIVLSWLLSDDADQTNQ